MHGEIDHTNDALNRGKFRDHYTNEVRILKIKKNKFFKKLFYLKICLFKSSLSGLKRITLLMWALNTMVCQDE